MLAYVGLVAPEMFRIPDPIFNQVGLDSVSAHNMLLGAGFGRGPMWWLFLCLGSDMQTVARKTGCRKLEAGPRTCFTVLLWFELCKPDMYLRMTTGDSFGDQSVAERS